MSSPTADSMERHAEKFAGKSEKLKAQAADAYTKLLLKTGDFGYARKCWLMALGLPGPAAELLPSELFKAGLAALAERQEERNRLATETLDRGVSAATEFILKTIAQADAGLLDGAVYNKAVETAKWLVNRGLGGGKSSKDRAPTIAVQVNTNLVQATNTKGMSEKQIGQYAAEIISECSGPGPGGVDSVEPADQGQAGEPSSTEAEQGSS